MKEGSTALWFPRNYAEHRPETEHPWYGHRVTILQAPNLPQYPVYKFRVDDAPKVNDPHAFEFWASETELKEVKP